MATDRTPVGLLRLAKIVKYNRERGFIEAELDITNQGIPNDSKTKRVQVPFGIYSTNGAFIGTYPTPGTPIIIGQGEGSNWYFVSYKISNIPKTPTLSDGDLLIQTDSDTKLLLNTNNEIILGSISTNTYINTSQSQLINKKIDEFSNTYSFTETGRDINGIVKREKSLVTFVPAFQKLTSEDYDERLNPISLDPTVATNITSSTKSKNPPFVERREVIHEFAYSSSVLDDISEAKIYAGKGEPTNKYILPDRRQSKVDLLSLSLVAPNYLMETVKGSVVDIFGNVLDINRVPIPVGQTPSISLKPDTSTSNKSTVYHNIRALERKNIAFHFEINARKDLSASNGQEVLPDINSTADYSRSRSRFFFDVDKEGQLKINIPSSSETGNIPLLTRYENYSTFGTEDNNNPNKLIYREDNLDIFLDSFALDGGDIVINDDQGIISPIDRITNQHIKHGTPYHSITGSLSVYHDGIAQQYLNIQANPTVNLKSLPTYTNIVSPTITVAGKNANAGGRSGSLNFDGSLELAIGANTIDRQSLWLDTAGGIIGNIGRDKNGISMGWSLDGDLLVEIGGYGVSNDSRFSNQNNSYRQGTLDIRVLNEGFTVSIIRIDKNGVSIISPSSINIHGRDVSVVAEGQLTLDGDTVILNGRLVNKFPNTSI